MRKRKGRQGRKAPVRLRHIIIPWAITGRGERQIESARGEADDSAVELLQPLVQRVIDTGAPVDLPGGYWLRCDQWPDDFYADIGRADLEGALKRYGDGAETLVSMRLYPDQDGVWRLTVRRATLDKLLIRNHYDFWGVAWEDTLAQVASEIGDLERRIAWAWLEMDRA